MHATINVLFFIDALKSGAIFSTQSITHIAERGPLDTCLSRLNKAGRIRRLAWGLYQNTPLGTEPIPSPLVIATEKARAFGKLIVHHGSTIAELLQFKPKNPKNKPHAIKNEAAPGRAKREINRYHTNGNSSRFYYLSSDGDFKRMHLHKLCPNKIRSYTEPGGQWISAVRSIGKKILDKCPQDQMPPLPWSAREKRRIRDQAGLLPNWLRRLLEIPSVDDFEQRVYPLIPANTHVPLASENQLSKLYGAMPAHRKYPFMLEVVPAPD